MDVSARIATDGQRSARVDASPAVLALVMVATLTGVVSSGCSGCSKGFQEKALRQSSLEMCEAMMHQSGDSCRAEVERRFPECSRPLLAQEVTSEAYARCLGFVVPPAPSGAAAILDHCEAPSISAKLSVSVAKNAPWDDSEPRVINDQTLHVSKAPALAASDLRTLRLEEQEGDRFVSVELTKEAAERFEAVTRANIGESMILALNESVVVAKIVSAIPGGKLVIAAPGARIQDFCGSP